MLCFPSRNWKSRFLSRLRLHTRHPAPRFAPLAESNHLNRAMLMRPATWRVILGRAPWPSPAARRAPSLMSSLVPSAQWLFPSSVGLHTSASTLAATPAASDADQGGVQIGAGAIAKPYRQEVRASVAELGFAPKLVGFLANEDPGAKAYVSNAGRGERLGGGVCVCVCVCVYMSRGRYARRAGVTVLSIKRTLLRSKSTRVPPFLAGTPSGRARRARRTASTLSCGRSTSWS